MLKKITSFEEYQSEYKKSVDTPEEFWAEKAETFQWKKKWDKVLDWNFKEPKIEWFKGGKLNITENCLDRHLESRGDQTAILWEPNDTEKQEAKAYTYKEVHAEVCRIANALKSMGVGKGDRVCIYLPMVPELAFSALACARIGAIHSIVFAGFSSNALADRVNHAEAKVILTSDGSYRGKKDLDIKGAIIDKALESCPTVTNVLVFKHTGREVGMTAGRDQWWHEVVPQQSATCEAEEMDAEDPLFILYTSGSTGKPKGVVHTTAGYMVYTAYSFTQAFQYEEGDVYWCTADIGWITGHSYIAYAPLLCGATQVMFEGVPNYPDYGRFWNIVEKYKVNTFYTAPTAVRALMAQGLEWVEKYDLSSLKVLGSVGEPINEEAWEWYHKNIGGGKCPIVDTWWQTETGGFMITPMANATPLKPAYATYPMPGVQPVLVDAEGKEIEGGGVEGNLCIKFPWPSIIRTTWGDHERCRTTYFATYENMYFTGDGARREENGMFRILGRVDDVINVSGHRMGTAELESGINEHPAVTESAVVGYPHEIKGQGTYAYVILENAGSIDQETLTKEVNAILTKVIGPIGKLDKLQIVPGLPKTRSGKIMRRILRKVAEGDVSSIGDTSTLLDPSVVDAIMDGALVELKGRAKAQ